MHAHKRQVQYPGRVYRPGVILGQDPARHLGFTLIKHFLGGVSVNADPLQDIDLYLHHFMQARVCDPFRVVAYYKIQALSLPDPVCQQQFRYLYIDPKQDLFYLRIRAPVQYGCVPIRCDPGSIRARIAVRTKLYYMSVKLG
jgi:hypothetical protein